MAESKSDLFTYIQRIGKYSFAEKAFNSVDALVLSQIVYMKFDEIIPLLKHHSEHSHHDPSVHALHPILLSNILQLPEAESIFSDPVYGELYRRMLELICESTRYGGTSMGCYTNCVDSELEHQFCGMLLHLPEDAPAPYFVAFRGTDETIVGWKENFNMAYLRKIPSQAMSTSFLEKIAERTSGQIIVAGHSKGGNLSIYSSACIPVSMQHRILSVYSFDGPGFTPSFYHKTGFQNIESRIQKIIPEHSIIGLLFSTRHSCRTIQSYANGLSQHDPLTWKIVGDDFVDQSGIRRPAYHRAQRINHWMQRMSSHERKHFIDTTFELLRSTEAGTVYELGKHPFQLIGKILHDIFHWKRDKRKLYHASMRKYFG